MRVYTPSANWLGHSVPESRWGQENADNTYRTIPVDHEGRYVVTGRRQQQPPSHISYMLVADTNTSVTVGLVEQHDMDIAADGTFEITLDKSPAAGRKNHIQITPDALYLFIRDTMGDWNQTPDALRVTRLDPPTRSPLSIDELTTRAVRVMRDGVAPAYYWQRIVLNIPVQSISQPHLTGAVGGLLTQLSCGGWTRLDHDEAAVITIDPLDAAYRNIQLYNLWGATIAIISPA
jgi:phosphatidylserine/phosphatidylglycerophosphate/cardiolipin synthase-like enzyme